MPTLIPGVIVVALSTWLSIWLSDYIGGELMGFEKSPISPVMIAIILGLGISALFQLPATLNPGFKFSVKKLLRLGIILLGIRLTIFDVFKLGSFGIPIVILCIVGALVFTTWINRRLNLPQRLGTLIAVGTSICGVTAIVATSPAIDAEEEESAYAVAVITVFGLFATIFYPYLANFIFNAHAIKAGLFLGTSVHETAQVVGAAKIYADIFAQTLTLDVATVTKLVRNVFMAFVIPFMAYYYARQSPVEDEFKGEKTSILKLLPMFILGFIAMAVFRSIGDAGINAGGEAFALLDGSAWKTLIATIKNWAEVLLVVALAGVGLGTNFRSVRALGIKPFIVGLGASLSVGLISYLAITLLGGLVTF
ncbi:MAG: putative sulfate exporter family transporter [Anaerolineales bacterium]|nr:putative sulfate exporter family transporter [Chloroflexota bacterium]MBL6982654.1 putative sulfate exporter family transporter [Anaerolineales bacterium]